MNKVLILFMSIGISLTGAAFSSEIPRQDATDHVSVLLKAELAKSYPGARIEITGPFNWVRGSLMKDVENVAVLGDNSRGAAQFLVNGGGASAEGYVSFAAWTKVPIAIRRVQPGERLTKEIFDVQDMNVATGSAHEFRGLILPASTDFSSLEARQTILEGQYPVSSGVRRVPDVKRGDSVRIQLDTGSVTLSTLGVAEEPAYINGQVRIVASQSKRQFVGKLLEGNIVEVKL